MANLSHDTIEPLTYTGYAADIYISSQYYNE